MKKIFSFFFVFLLNFNNLNANDGIYFLDIDYILNNSNHGKLIINKLQEISTKNNSLLKKNEEELSSIEDEITKVKNVISKDELNKKIESFKKKVSEYRILKKSKSEEFNKLKKIELDNFFKKITPLIETFMQTKSIKIILDKKNIFIADSNYDITEDLIKYLNEKIN